MPLSTGMNQTLEDLYCVKSTDIPRLVTVITHAFLHDPGIAFSFPKESTRERLTSYMWEMVLRDRIKYGEVYAPSSKLEGAALWLASQYWDMGLGRIFRALSVKKLLRLVTTARNGYIINSAMEKAHKAIISTPHLYLTVLAVDPVHQGKKFASRLLRPMIARCDQTRTPIYLETATEQDVQLYLHFGFEIKREFQIGNSNLIMRSMLYTPKMGN